MANKKIIAKNALFLYVRMGIVMAITLYTSRIMLSILGIEDYGIYNIVAGVVVIFSFITTSMTSATQRFLSYSLGENNGKELNKVYSTAINLHVLFGLMIVLISETIGLWFFYSKLSIPEERQYAAIWVYHLSVAIAFFEFIKSPSLSVIISFEKMGLIAILSIIETVLKLLIVLVLPLLNNDALIIYSLLLLFVTIFMAVGSFISAKLSIPVLRYKVRIERNISRSMIGFLWWHVFGGLGNIARGQGVNILFNIYYGVIVNAAVGISNQVSRAVNMFMTNFTTAFNPQIVKLYSEKNLQEFNKLTFQASKYSFLLMAFLTIPLIGCINDVLNVWLGHCPEYAAVFCACTVLAVNIDALSAPLWTAIGATGYVKTYQILMAFLSILVLPCCYILLKEGFSPAYCMFCNVIVNLLMLLVRVYLLKRMVAFNARFYILCILGKGLVIYVISFLLCKQVSHITNYPLANILITALFSFFFNTLLFGYLYLYKDERMFIKAKALELYKKKIY